MATDIKIEKYRQYFEIIRFNRRSVENFFKFYFMAWSIILAFLGWICNLPIEKYFKESDKLSFEKLKCLLPEPIYFLIRSWGQILLLAFVLILLFGIALLFLTLTKRVENVKRLKILNSKLNKNRTLKEEIDIKYLSWGEDLVYIFVCSILNGVSCFCILSILNIIGKLSMALTKISLLENAKIDLLSYRFFCPSFVIIQIFLCLLILFSLDTENAKS